MFESDHQLFPGEKPRVHGSLSKDSLGYDLTTWMHSLTGAFDGRTCHRTGFIAPRLILFDAKGGCSSANNSSNVSLARPMHNRPGVLSLQWGERKQNKTKVIMQGPKVFKGAILPTQLDN